jgi:molybdenum cofactor cytidylyltransferase
MVYGILLAAGTSSRMGRPKQLLRWAGQPLVRHVAEQALASQISGLVIVIGAAAAQVQAALNGIDGPVLIVENPDYASGQSHSLQAGLSALPVAARAALVLLVDQPLVTSALLDQLIAAHVDYPDALAVIPHYQGQRGNPVLLAQGLFAELRGVHGDMGARQVLVRHAAHVYRLDVDDRAVVSDMDTPEDYAGMHMP